MALLGQNAVAYRSTTALNGTTNTAGTVTWTEVDNIQDETDNFSAESIDVTTRATAKLGWNAVVSGPKNGEITFSILLDPNDALATALMNAFLNGTFVTMMFLSGDKDDPGSFGLAANWSVQMTMNRPVKGAQTADVTLNVASHPEWVLTT